MFDNLNLNVPHLEGGMLVKLTIPEEEIGLEFVDLLGPLQISKKNVIMTRYLNKVLGP